MENVSDILGRQEKSLIWVSSHEMVLKALRLMKENDQGAILIMDNRRLAGIFSEGDLTRRVVLEHKDPATTRLYDVMTTEVYTVEAHIGVERCLALMNQLRVRHMPVVRKTEVLGFLSILDVVQSVLDAKLQMIDKLEQYVSETWPI